MPCMARSRIECGRFASQRSRGSFTCESAEIISRDGSSIPILQGLSNDVFPRQQYHYRFFADGIFLLGVLNPIGATGWARPPGFDIADPLDSSITAASGSPRNPQRLRPSVAEGYFTARQRISINIQQE